MGYEIEISSSLNAPSMMKDKVIAKAYRCNCEYHYNQYELEGRRRQIYRKHHIMTFIFPEDGAALQSFIRYIKSQKGLHIECISTDVGSFELLYASPKYLSSMDKAKAREYRDKIKS